MNISEEQGQILIRVPKIGAIAGYIVGGMAALGGVPALWNVDDLPGVSLGPWPRVFAAALAIAAVYLAVTGFRYIRQPDVVRLDRDSKRIFIENKVYADAAAAAKVALIQHFYPRGGQDYEVVFVTNENIKIFIPGTQGNFEAAAKAGRMISAYWRLPFEDLSK